MSDYVVICERDDDGWGAYIPDVSGDVSHGETEAGVADSIREAFAVYLRALRRGRTLLAVRSVSDALAA